MIDMHNLLLYPNQSRPVRREDFATVAGTLAHLGYALFTCDSTFADNAVRYLPAEEAFSFCDAAVVLGGDGTMLAAARHARKTGIPLLGINFGTLGYMSELEISECELLADLPNARIETRMMLDVTAEGDGIAAETHTALNEAAICRAKPGTLVTLSLYCDGSKVSSYRADGIIVSTPTGSSGYNLSVGGPIIDPKLNAFCVSPLAPHTLSAARPLVFSPESVISVCAEGEISVAYDSRLFPLLPHGGTVTIRRSENVLHLLKLKNAGFYDTLTKKLT